jgi:hypothetical protein
MKSAIYRSLEDAIHHSSCVSSRWIHDFDNLHVHPSQSSSSVLLYNNDSLTWVDKNDRLFCLAFPAILNLKGEYTEIDSYSDIVDDQSVDVSVVRTFMIRLILFFCLARNFSIFSSSYVFSRRVSIGSSRMFNVSHPFLGENF